jgi:hypothetical protein
MRPQDVIGFKVRDGWRPSIAMLREVKRRGIDRGINPKTLMADNERKPLSSFLGWWKSAFTYEATMPNPLLPMLTAEGKPTQEFLDLWEAQA